MDDPSDTEQFDDVDEAVLEEWTAETTPYERVRSVIATTYTPVTADDVASEARTAPKTARKHLEALAEEGFVTTEPGEHGGTSYRRSSESLVVEQAADILANVSTEELRSRVSEMRERLTEFRTEYGVESPEELAVARTNETLDGATGDQRTDSEDHSIDPETLQEWQTTRRNLAFANAALSIANAEKFVDGGAASTGGSVSAR